MGGKADQTFSFEIVACLIAAMSETGATVGTKHFALMAKLDGSKTASGYEHAFRAVKARAKEINQSKGEVDTATPKATKTAPAGSAQKRQRSGRKAAAEKKNYAEADDEDEDEDDVEESPTKKMKSEPVQEAVDEEDVEV